jgi:hypothetical protein
MENQEGRAATPARARHATRAADRDWLARPEPCLAAEFRDALAHARAATTPAAERPLFLALVALLPQAVSLRALVRDGRIAPSAARAALRSDFASGYLLGLSAAGGDPVAAIPDARARRETLIRLHAAMFGAGAALEFARRWASGMHILVGAAFGDGLLAAEADLAEVAARLGRGADPVLEGGLLRWIHAARQDHARRATTVH